jgi:hypothetical protein
MRCAVSFVLEKGTVHRKFAEILKEIHENSDLTPVDHPSNIIAKPLGYYSAYGSYWLSLSLISDGVEESNIEKFLTHLEKWSYQHGGLKPRYLHLRAELACRTSVTEA